MRRKARRAVFYARYGFGDTRRAEFGKFIEKFARSFIFSDGNFFREHDVARVHGEHRLHDGDARFPFACEHCRLYGRCAAVLRQKRAVDVQRIKARDCQHFLAQHLPECARDEKIGVKRLQIFDALFSDRSIFQHLYALIQRKSFDGRGR